MVHSDTIEIAGVGPVLFEHSKKAKRVIISVRPFAGVRVAVPYGLSFQKAKEFVCIKVSWIQKHLARMKQYEQSDSAVVSVLDPIDRAEVKRKLINRLEYLAAEHGFSYTRVFIRNQKTRLGTCSNRNNIGLNIKLTRLPEELMDYVILHELAHTRVKNHGADFWMLMDKLVGNGKAKAASLRECSIRHLQDEP
jgi:predicted metal-dependent hydrolase